MHLMESCFAIFRCACIRRDITALAINEREGTTRIEMQGSRNCTLSMHNTLSFYLVQRLYPVNEQGQLETKSFLHTTVCLLSFHVGEKIV